MINVNSYDMTIEPGKLVNSIYFYAMLHMKVILYVFSKCLIPDVNDVALAPTLWDIRRRDTVVIFIHSIFLRSFYGEWSVKNLDQVDTYQRSFSKNISTVWLNHLQIDSKPCDYGCLI